jgi:uncharacterized repeat protein (TIGR01451 family)/CSLREA domain-containing protein
MADVQVTRQQRRAIERAARKAQRNRGMMLAAGALLAAGSASAAVITVNTNADTIAVDTKCSLREAIQNANDNAATNTDCVAGVAGLDTIQFALANPSTITLGGTELPIITDDLTITGPGVAALTITGNNLSRIFDIENTSAYLPIDVGIGHLTITGGNSITSGYFGGAITVYGENLALDDVVISGSLAPFDGGGVAFDGYYYNQLSITNSTITGNNAVFGNGGGVDVYYQYSTVYLKNVAITNNKSGYDGGGLDAVAYSGADLTIANTIISGNSSGNQLGSVGDGGGVRFVGSGLPQATFNIVDSIISGNVADPNDVAAAPLPGSDASDIGYGGGLYLGFVNGVVSRTTISGNTAYAGGGVDMLYGAQAIFEDSTIAGNAAKNPTAPGFGGGVAVEGFPYETKAQFVESTISGNSAQTGAGGLDVIGDPTYLGSATLTNSIVANNTSASSTPDVGTTGTITANYTLIENLGTATVAGANNIIGVDPALGPLATNGSMIVAGPVGATASPMTMLPDCGSPVINAGDPAFAPPPAIDERGFPRVAGGRIDMGAVEFQPSSVQLTTNVQSINEAAGTVSVTAVRTGFDGPLAVSYGTTNGTALAGSDYTAAAGTLNWAASDTANKSFNVSITNDLVFEGNETFTATISAPTCNATLGANATQTITIIDNETQPTISIGSVSLPESTSPFNFPVTLSGPSAQTITVSYATSDGTANAVSDYAATSGTLTFNPGVTAQSIPVTIVNDTTLEPNETFTVTLNPPVNATLNNTNALGTIQNDDAGTADLGIAKVASGPFYAGNQATYNITVTNAGPNSAASVVVTDALPAGATFVSASPSQGSCSGTTTITCNLGALANGGSASIVLRVTPTGVGPLSNTASVSAAPQPDPNPANDASTSAVVVNSALDIPTLGEWMKIMLAVTCAMIALGALKRD